MRANSQRRDGRTHNQAPPKPTQTVRRTEMQASGRTAPRLRR